MPEVETEVEEEAEVEEQVDSGKEEWQFLEPLKPLQALHGGEAEVGEVEEQVDLGEEIGAEAEVVEPEVVEPGDPGEWAGE